MGKWDEYVVTEDVPKTDKWSQYESYSDNSKEEEYSPVQRSDRFNLKSSQPYSSYSNMDALKDTGKTVVNNLADLGENTINTVKSIPQIPSAIFEAVKHPLVTAKNIGSAVGNKVGEYNTMDKFANKVSTNPIGFGSDVVGILAGTKAAYDLGNIGLKGIRTTGKSLSSNFHNEEFIKGQARNVRDMAEGMRKSLHDLYGNFYKEKGLADVPLDSTKADTIMLAHNLPDSLIAEIDTKIGRIDTVGKAHEARQLIDSKLSELAKTDFKGNFSPIEAKKSVRKDFKDLMRETTRSVNPEATVLLEDLDKHAFESIYPRIDKFEKMVGNKPLNKQYPKTASVLSIMKGGLSKAPDVDIMLDTPEKIKLLGKYLDSPEFNADLEKTLKSSNDFVKKMKKFQSREKIKARIETGIIDATGIGLIRKLFGF